MRELIEKQAAIDAHCELCVDRNKYFCNSDICPDVEVFQLIPSVQSDHIADADKKEIVEAIFHEKYEDAMDILSRLPSAQPERKKGEWSEKEVLHKSEAETVIEEWQSCKCSVCGRYDTRPYLYYFDEPHFCSWCGADMRGEYSDE